MRFFFAGYIKVLNKLSNTATVSYTVIIEERVTRQLQNKRNLIGISL